MSLPQIVHDAPTGVFLFALFIVGAFAGLPLFVAVRSWWQMRALMSLRRIPVASAQDGYVRVEGNTRPSGPEPLSSPLTQSKTCWYHIVVEDSVPPYGETTNRTGTGWWKVREETSSTPFIVRDDSGEIVVDPHGADVTPTDRSIWYGPEPEPENRDPERFPPGQNPKGDLLQVEWRGGDQRYRYTEERIYPDDPIFIQGEARLEYDDEDEDEEYDLEDETGDAVPAAAETATGRTGIEHDDDDVAVDEELRIVRPSRRTQPFLIATTAPGDMVKVYRGAIVGTLILAVIGTFALYELVRMRFG